MKKAILAVLAVGGILFASLQLVRPSIPRKTAATEEVQAPEEVKAILRRDCYDCHSDETRLKWFDQVVPAYWLVRHDVLEARGRLNFSTLGAKPAAAQRGALFESVTMMQLGAMPLAQYTALHSEAKVRGEDIAALKAYLKPWGQLPPATPATAAPAAWTKDLHTVKPEGNGLAFDPDFVTWKPLSFTDRGDNNTFRFILGNDLAQKAIASGAVKPWPDGARIAKIAWLQELSADGTIHPGKFIQVELMVKDAQKYRTTAGWGWGRWRGPELTPWGTDAQYVQECTGCHLPVRGNDWVYTQPITATQVPGMEVVNNAAAALPATLPWQPLHWEPITMYVDPAKRTLAVLYGNEAALQSVRHHTAYAAGAVVALITWSERDDAHWFGARIPQTPLCVEFVATSTSGSATYRRFSGSALHEERTDANDAAKRMRTITTLPPVELPRI